MESVARMTTMRINRDLVNEYMKGVFRPGAVVGWTDDRDEGLRCATEFCRAASEGAYEGLPENIEILDGASLVPMLLNARDAPAPDRLRIAILECEEGG